MWTLFTAPWTSTVLFVFLTARPPLVYSPFSDANTGPVVTNLRTRPKRFGVVLCMQLAYGNGPGTDEAVRWDNLYRKSPNGNE